MGRIVINETENKQTVILNDSPSGVEGGYFDSQMNWHDMGGSTGPKYEYNINDLYKVYGSISPRSITQAPHEIMVFLNGYAERRSYMVLNNEAVVGAMMDSTTKMCDDYNWRLIPIPSDAKKVTISISPSSQYIGPSFFTWDPEGVGLTRALNPGWNQGSYTLDMTPGTYQFLSVVSKYDSAGSSYPSEPSNISIVFEKE